MNKETPGIDLLEGSIAKTDNVCHQLWLIYSQLKDAEDDQARRLELLERSREELGQVLNDMYRSAQLTLGRSPKSPRNQAANLNCRDRQFNLTPDNLKERGINTHSCASYCLRVRMVLFNNKK